MAHFITGCLWLRCVLWTVTLYGKGTAPTRTGRTQLRLPSPVIPANILALLCSNSIAWSVSALGLWLPLLSLFIIAVINYCLLLVFFLSIYFVSTFLAIFSLSYFLPSPWGNLRFFETLIWVQMARLGFGFSASILNTKVRRNQWVYGE